MESHRYSFNLAELARSIGIPFGVLLLIAGLMHGGAALGWLPAPKPTLDADRTIIVHQAAASLEASGAEIVLIGDSSCLMNVDAQRLGELTRRRVLNLGTLSHLGLDDHAVLIRNYLAMNPDSVRVVILLMHPETLRLPGREAYFSEVLHDYLAGRERRSPAPLHALGVSIFQERIQSRAIPSPLPGAYGQTYGFSRNLWRRMDAHSGSAFDPGTFDFENWRGRAEYRLAESYREPARRFRGSVPHPIKLLAAITPSPESIVPEGQSTIARLILSQWAEWLEADGTFNLPVALPDSSFASSTHLQPGTVYTELLARELEKLF